MAAACWCVARRPFGIPPHSDFFRNPTVASSGQGPAWFFRLGLFDDICHATPDGMTRVIAFRLKSLSGSAGVPLSCATVARCQETRVKLHCFGDPH